MCYASLSEDEITKGRKILNFVDGNVYNKSNIETFPAYLDKKLLFNISRKMDEENE